MLTALEPPEPDPDARLGRVDAAVAHEPEARRGIAAGSRVSIALGAASNSSRTDVYPPSSAASSSSWIRSTGSSTTFLPRYGAKKGTTIDSTM